MTAHPAKKAAKAPISGKTTALRATLFILFQDEVRAAVLRPRPLVVTRIQRLFLAEADRGERPLRYAEGHEVAHHGRRATFAQRHVVLRGAALVAMPLDLEPRPGVLLHVVGDDLTRPAAVLFHLRLVEVEPDVVER